MRYQTKIGLYYNIVRLDGFLDNLAFFLAHEIAGEKDSSWVSFLKESTYQKMSGNEIFLEKKGSDIYIGNLYCEGLDEEYNNLKISMSGLLELIKKWENLLNNAPDEIILSEQTGRFELVGHNYCKEPTCGEVEG